MVAKSFVGMFDEAPALRSCGFDDAMQRVDLAAARVYLVGVHVYLLSVLTTIAAGATLAAGYLVERFPVLEPLKRFAASSRAAGTLGAIAAAVGFVKLFARAPRPGSRASEIEGALMNCQIEGAIMSCQLDRIDQIVSAMRGQLVILGDFLPAVAGMLLGGMLLIDRYRDQRRLRGGAAEPIAADDGDDDSDPIPVTPSADSSTGILKIGDALTPYRTPLGLAGMVAGVIHFLLAGVPIL